MRVNCTTYANVEYYIDTTLAPHLHDIKSFLTLYPNFIMLWPPFGMCTMQFYIVNQSPMINK